MTGNAPAAKSGNVVTPMKPHARFVAQLEVEAGLEGGSSAKEISQQVVTNILEADSLEAAFEAAEKSGPKSAKDLVDTEWSVTDFEVVKSDDKYDSPLGHYLRVQATSLESGEPDLWVTGAPNIVTLLWKARQADRLPLDVRIVGRETSNGVLLSLKMLKPRAIKAA